MRLLIERDDAASAAGRPSLLDDEFIQTSCLSARNYLIEQKVMSTLYGLLFPFF